MLRIAIPSFALVPSSRTTMGFGSVSKISSASFIPRATSSPRVMPPKILKSIESTFSSSIPPLGGQLWPHFARCGQMWPHRAHSDRMWPDFQMWPHLLVVIKCGHIKACTVFWVIQYALILNCLFAYCFPMVFLTFPNVFLTYS